MSSKTYGSMDGFGFKVIATGEFIDEGYLITVHSIRLSPEALGIWHISKTKGVPSVHDAYKSGKKQLHREWEDKIAKLIGYESSGDSGFSVTQNVSNIFTIVIMER